MKKNYCLALMILLITGIGFTNLAVGYSPIYTPNTNYRSAYIPNPSYNPSTPPIDLSAYNCSLRSVPLPIGMNTITKVTFRIVGDSNEPIPGAQVVGLDGSSNSFQKSTDNNGYVAIDGTPGNWQFTGYAEGYFPKSVNSNIKEYDTNILLMLQRIGVQEKPNDDHNDNQFGNKFPTTNRIASETNDKTIDDWLCESNGNSEQDSDMTPDQSTDTGAKG